MFKNQIGSVALFFVLCGGAVVAPPLVGTAQAAAASVSIQADVQASGKAAAVLGDQLYGSGDYVGALTAYGNGFTKAKDASFIYAEAACHKALAHKAEAETMFKMYLSSGKDETLKYANEAKAALGGVKNAGKALIGGLTGAVTTTVGAVANVTGTVVFGIFGALKVSVAGEIKDAAAKAKAEAGDAAYLAKNFAAAAKSYGEAFATGEPAVALFAEGSAEAQAGNVTDARALLTGYLSAEPKGKHADDARQLLLAIGGLGAEIPKVVVKGKAAADVKAEATAGDEAYKAGQFLSAAKSYAAGYAKKSSEAALLYGQGMAELSAGKISEAKEHLSAYLKTGGKLEFKASAEAALKANGSAS